MKDSRIPKVAIGILIVLVHAARGVGQVSAPVAPVLGPAPTAPLDVSGLPGKGPRKLDFAPGLSVNTSSREQARQFYNSIYLASENVPIDSAAITSECFAGTNSTALLNAELLRINWFRAMVGIPAAVTFDAAESVEDQSAALMMAANDQLMHDAIPTNWSCYTTTGANAAANSDLALNVNGPDAITGFILDSGTVNADVGHRRWILYPQTQVMGSGDVPAQSNYVAANATYIIDGNVYGPRPATTFPYVAWPPPGYVPYQVVFPQWSFSLSNADLSLATVTMASNGVPMDVVMQPYTIGFKGEDTCIWYPSNLVWTNYNTVFPFNGVDTVYDITVNTAGTNAGSQAFSYSVTVFDPAVPGADYVPTVISGTNNPSVNENNPYSCTPSANPGIAGYQWVASRTADGGLTDLAKNGLANFTIFPPPTYSIVTNTPIGEAYCFHLAHPPSPAPQWLQFKETLFPSAGTTLSFQSLLGFATTNEVARVQVSTNGGVTWIDLYAQAGTGVSTELYFTTHTLSLSNCAGQITSVRFDYDYVGGYYYGGTSNYIGWYIYDVALNDAIQLADSATNATVSTNFNFVPSGTGTWLLQARGMIFNQFGLDWSPPTPVTGVTTPARTLVLLGPPAMTPNEAQIPFTLMQGAASSFTLLQASQPAGPWTTDAGAVLTTQVQGTSFQFTAPVPGATTFYRVLAR